VYYVVEFYYEIIKSEDGILVSILKVGRRAVNVKMGLKEING
jgi:hypothetical protein